MNNRMRFYQIRKNAFRHKKATERRNNILGRMFIQGLILMFTTGLAIYILFFIAK